MTRKGVWDIQDVRDKHLKKLWYPKGRLYSWGSGSYGDGLGGRVTYSSPVEIPGDWCLELPNIGHWPEDALLAVKRNGTLWGWGRNEYGGLGQNDNTFYSSPVQIGTDNTWPTTDVRSKISTGFNTVIAIKTDGTLWAWGNNTFGRLGQNDIIHYSSPVQIGSDNNWKILSGRYAIKTDNTLWVWGGNEYGQLANSGSIEPNSHRSSPVQIPGTWLNVSGQMTSSVFAIRKLDNPSPNPGPGDEVQQNNSYGTLWGWGGDWYGRLGQGPGAGSGTRFSSPVQIGTQNYWSAKTEHLKAAFTGFAISTNTPSTEDETDPSNGDYVNGILWAWGRNRYGVLGLNENTPSSEGEPNPQKVLGNMKWKNISSSYHEQALGITEDGHLWSWGDNHDGMLGLNEDVSPSGNSRSRSSPVRIGTYTDWTSVESWYGGGLAIRSAVPSMKKREL